MRADRSEERLACPHCRANNFVGQAQCWQCHGSLPPPEEIQRGLQAVPAVASAAPYAMQQAARANVPPPAPPAVTPYAQQAASAGPRTSGIMPLVICIALLTASALLWVGIHHSGPSAPTPAQFSAESAEMKGLRADARGVVPESELPNSGLPDPSGVRLSVPSRDPLPTSADPTEMAARHAIEHALPRLGLPPSNGSDGKVHLRNGDSISPEQYEDVQQKLQHNPILGTHPPVPRL